MPHNFQAIILDILIFSFLNNFDKANSNFYTDIQQKYDYEDIRQDIDQNKDLKVSNISYIKTNTSNVLPSPIIEKDGKINQKQYEIVDVLWRKTKFLLDIDALTTHKDYLFINEPSFTKNPQTSVQYKSKNSASSPRCLDFYCSNLFKDQLEQKDLSSLKIGKQKKSLKNDQKGQDKMVDKTKKRVFHRPIFTFRLNNRNIKEANVDSANYYFNLNKHGNNLETNDTNQLRAYMNTSDMVANKRITRNNNDSQWLSIFFNDPLNKLNLPNVVRAEIPFKSTTIYDRIKFFEMYDRNTVATTIPDYDFKRRFGINNHKEISKNPIDTYENKTELVMNAIKDDGFQGYGLKDVNKSAPFSSTASILVKATQNNSKENHRNEKKIIIGKNLQNKLNLTTELNKRQHLVWTDFPYISAYIYEPLSIYCDAAAINSYWLIAAGSCLARHHKNNLVNERSAYISYCGDKWWDPESIAYVRRSFIHPLFNYRDKIRRHHYNIGAVQVITSMINSCPGWGPVSLVSHKFAINERGFPATAIGWGLDRYNTKFPFYELPKRPLFAYEGLIFSKSCTKAIEFSKEDYERELNVKNMYCLSLPYSGERKNTAHGSLLLVQGKLMALAMQKARNRESELSAQYTGIWRVVPWILELTHNITKESFANKQLS